MTVLPPIPIGPVQPLLGMLLLLLPSHFPEFLDFFYYMNITPFSQFLPFMCSLKHVDQNTCVEDLNLVPGLAISSSCNENNRTYPGPSASTGGMLPITSSNGSKSKDLLRVKEEQAGH